MLRSLNSLIGYRIIAKDGAAGQVLDLSINTSDWRVTELVAKVGGWWRAKEVRIPSICLRRAVGVTDMLAVSLTKEQIRECPSTVDAKIPPRARTQDPLTTEVPSELVTPQPVRWQSMVAYQVQALDGRAGVLKDLIMCEENWHIRYLVVKLAIEDASHQTLVSSNWVSSIHDDRSSILLNLNIPELIGSPEYDPIVPINRDIEGNFYDYYGQPFRHE